MDAKGIVLACPNCGRRNRIAFERLGREARCGSCATTIPPASSPVEVSSGADFLALIGRSPVPVLTDFWAAWCGPCKMVAPELEKIAANNAGELIVAKINTEQHPDLAQRYGISSIPCLLLFMDGQETGRSAGARPASAIQAFIAGARRDQASRK